MAYPPSYERDYSFTEFETLNPGQPKPGAALDTEFDDVSNALTATQDALALIQRSDGALANDSVGEDQLQDDVFDGLVDGITAEAEAARDAAAVSADAAAASAIAADASADAALASQNLAAGSAALAGSSQTIAQDAANEAALSAADADASADEAELAANTTAGSVAEAQMSAELAFKWAEYLAGPVEPAPPGWPEAVDDGMFSSKWWAIRSRDYNTVTHIDLGSGQTDIGAAWEEWIALGNEQPLGLIYVTWGTPPLEYALTDPTAPEDPDSWTLITGGVGPAGPPNTLTMGTVTTGVPGSAASASITGVSPNQVLNLTIPRGDVGPQGIQGNPGPINTLTIGTVTTGAAGSPADASITGVAPNQILNLAIPQGIQGVVGPPNSLAIGSVTTLAPGAPATATITGTPPTQTLDLGIPQGATGSAGVGSPANPTALIGLAAINGVATSFIRSDGAPALSQAIAPTWTAQHIFSGPGGGALTSSIILNGAGGGSIMFAHPTAPVNKRQWDIVAGGDGRFYFRALTDAGAAGAAWMFVTRTDAATIDSVTFPSNFRALKNGRFAGWHNAAASDPQGPAVEIGYDTGEGWLISYNRTGSAYIPLNFDASVLKFYTAGVSRMTLSATGLLDVGGSIHSSGWVRSVGGVANIASDKYLAWGNMGSYPYGSCYVYGASSGYTGLGLYDGIQYPYFMSNGTAVGLYMSVDGKWLIYRQSATVANTGYNLEALSFNVTSARKFKRETGKPTRAADILSRLRPILYRLLKDESREQLGLIAEEVHDVCPQMSDGKTISYDRLAILLLADWQESRGIAAN
jgi:hypothetical protein